MSKQQTIDLNTPEGKAAFLKAQGQRVPSEPVKNRKIVPSKMSYHASLPYPPALNRYYRTWQGRILISREGREYRKSIEAYQPVIGVFTGRLEVTIRAWMPDRRRRDVDGICKSLLDAMTHAGFWEDDSQLDDLRIIRMGIEKPGRVEVFIQQISP